MRDDWTTYRFVIYDSWVAFDVTTLLASGPHPARFSAFYHTAPLSRGPHLARFWTVVYDVKQARYYCILKFCFRSYLFLLPACSNLQNAKSNNKIFFYNHQSKVYVSSARGNNTIWSHLKSCLFSPGSHSVSPKTKSSLHVHVLLKQIE